MGSQNKKLQAGADVVVELNKSTFLFVYREGIPRQTTSEML